MNTVKDYIKDFCLFLLLCFFIKLLTIVNKKKYTAQKKSKTFQAIKIHTIDEKIQNVLAQTQQKLNRLSLLSKNISYQQEKIAALQIEFDDINYQYNTNSPALYALGPFGSIAIVLKELGLEKRLTILLEEIHSLLHKVEKLNHTNDAQTTE